MFTNSGFAGTFDQIDFYKRFGAAILEERIEKLKEQLTSGILEEVFEVNIIRLQGLVKKYSLSPVTYEDGLSELESHAHNLNNSEKHLDILGRVKYEFRGELKSQPLLLKECIQSAKPNEADYYKSLLDIKYPTTEKVIHNNDLPFTYSKKSSSEFSKIRNLSKFILGNPAQAVTVFLATQAICVNTAAIQQSNFSGLVVEDPTLPLNNSLLNIHSGGSKLSAGDSVVTELHYRNEANKLALSKNSGVRRSKRSDVANTIGTPDPHGTFTRTNPSSNTGIMDYDKLEKGIDDIEKGLRLINAHSNTRLMNYDKGLGDIEKGLRLVNHELKEKSALLSSSLNANNDRNIGSSKSLKDVLKDLKDRLASLETQLEEMQKRLDNLDRSDRQKYEELKQAVGRVRQIIEDIKQDIEDLEKQIEQIELPDNCVLNIRDRNFEIARKNLMSIADDRKIVDIVRRVYNSDVRNFGLLKSFLVRFKKSGLGGKRENTKKIFLFYEEFISEAKRMGHFDETKACNLFMEIILFNKKKEEGFPLCQLLDELPAQYLNHCIRNAKFLIRKNNIILKNDLTALHIVSKNGNLDLAQCLIRKRAKVDAISMEKETPLHLAAEFGHLSLVKMLIEEGANIKARNVRGETPPEVANRLGKSGIANFLIEKQNEYDSQLLTAIGNGDVSEVRNLLSRGANPKVREEAGYRFTPLSKAIWENKSDIAILLIDRDVDINAPDGKGNTPLHLAVEKDNLQVVEKLVRKGANITAENLLGETPLRVATIGGRLKIADFLTEEQYLSDLLANVSNNVPNSNTVFNLAFGVKRVMERSDYHSISSEKRSVLEKIKRELPESVRNVVFSSELCIKNVYRNEYFYNTDGPSFGDGRNREVSTSWETLGVDNLWKVERYDDSFFIKSAHYGGYLYASSKKHDNDRRRVFVWAPGGKVDGSTWEIVPHGDNCYIRNTYRNEYLFASDYNVVATLKGVFTWIPGGRVQKGVWRIEGCRFTRIIRDTQKSESKMSLDSNLDKGHHSRLSPIQGVTSSPVKQEPFIGGLFNRVNEEREKREVVPDMEPNIVSTTLENISVESNSTSISRRH